MRGMRQKSICRNQIGACRNYFGARPNGVSPVAGLPGDLAPPGLGGDIGEVSEMKADLASRRMRSDRCSTTPKSRKGRAVAATRSFARRGVLASGSQRKSWADMKNVRQAQ